MADDTPGKAIGRRLRALREDQLLSRPELAKRAGVGVATIDHVERGISARPRRTTLEKLARPLGVSVEELISGSPLKAPYDQEAPPLELFAMYGADDDVRREALAGAAAEARAGYVAEIDAALERAESALLEDAESAAGAEDESVRLAYASRRTVLRRHISRLVILRDEATGEEAAPLALSEIEEAISA